MSDPKKPNAPDAPEAPTWAGDQFAGQGGSYVVQPDGTRRRLSYWEAIGEPEPEPEDRPGPPPDAAE